jgi:hypothetical protein
MARILKSPLIALAQLNRSEETFEGDEDLDSFLKDSGNIEQDTDTIHYLRGSIKPGVVTRKWRLHKDRNRASGLNFKFLLHQGVFRFEPVGDWTPHADSDGQHEFEEGNGFDTIT